ncbi:hypothetical protein K353_04719 [Kitasatospora sp. SolWspMP-SS2h]|uniref:DUF2087 domain-containing protein n=1 Tax=Kitasatospora sp. SolWspMP-SS2h TaxID=1305729 RepID=UPI000DBA5164|nr:DUF2087 domain-containing protein [Kitasatospora sp. SolWspMP-SS2h]RAJ36891.1 hypothetical protein K353_04719 [Kitasatospora sp. SolWspMP-SS2h]
MSVHEPPADLAAFFTDGRLVSVPRRPARRAALLEHLVRTLFDPERPYREQEVNEALLTVHPDTAMLRRYLIEARLLTRTRDGSSYRRTVAADRDAPTGPAAPTAPVDAQPPAA